jgi:hypothetical protein
MNIKLNLNIRLTFLIVCANSDVEYGTWEEDIIEIALATLRSGGLGLNCAAVTYDVLKATLMGEFMGPR